VDLRALQQNQQQVAAHQLQQQQRLDGNGWTTAADLPPRPEARSLRSAGHAGLGSVGIIPRFIVGGYFAPFVQTLEGNSQADDNLGVAGI